MARRRNSSGWDFGTWRQELAKRSSGVKARKQRARRGEATWTSKPKVTYLEPKKTRALPAINEKRTKTKTKTRKPRTARRDPQKTTNNAPRTNTRPNVYTEELGIVRNAKLTQVVPGGGTQGNYGPSPFAGHRTELIFQPPAGRSDLIYPPSSQSGHIYQPPPAPTNHYYQPQPGQTNGIYQAPPLQTNGLYQAPPAQTNGVYQALPVQTNGIYQTPPPQTNGVYQTPPPQNNGVYQAAPAESPDTYQGMEPLAQHPPIYAPALPTPPVRRAGGLSVHVFRFADTDRAFWLKIRELCEKWHLECKACYRQETGRRLIRGGNGRTNVCRRGKQLQSFSETLQKINTYAEVNDEIFSDGGRLSAAATMVAHIILALKGTQVIAMMDFYLDMKKHEGKIRAAVSRRVLDRSLPKGVMSSCVYEASQLIIASGYNYMEVPVMAESAVTYWTGIGLPSYRRGRATNVRYRTRQVKCTTDDQDEWPGTDALE